MENSIKLISYYGSDEIHALSAWTSTCGAFLDEIEEMIVYKS